MALDVDVVALADQLGIVEEEEIVRRGGIGMEGSIMSTWCLTIGAMVFSSSLKVWQKTSFHFIGSRGFQVVI